MIDSPVRLGIVGCGQVVQRGYLPALAGAAELELRAVADPIADRRRIAGAAAYPDLEGMLASEQLDAVLVCSPPQLHVEHATRCAAAGIPALVEKPPGMTAAEARLLSALDPEPVIGFNRRFASRIPAGTTAALTARRITALFDAPPADWLREDGTDALLDLGCHLVDLVCWLTRRAPTRARADSIGASRASFDLELTDGARAYIECGEAAAYREVIELRTGEGTARTWEWPLRGTHALAATLRRSPPQLVRSWRAQLLDFAQLIRTREPGRLARARDAVQVMATLEAVRRSAERGRDWVAPDAGLLRSGEAAG